MVQQLVLWSLPSCYLRPLLSTKVIIGKRMGGGWWDVAGGGGEGNLAMDKHPIPEE